MTYKKRALVAMSGGVDSSAAACLALASGLECIAVTMRLTDDTDTSAAREIADRLGMRFYEADLRSDFRRCVIDHFASSYERGSTPNPCVECNRTMKFGRLFDLAEELGCGAIVTGHYARIDRKAPAPRLLKALDRKKDQSYFLYAIPHYRLSDVIFPLGELTKDDARAIAAEHDLPSATSAESQDVCFIPDGDRTGFIERLLGRKSAHGDIVDKNGKILGQHRGIVKFTIGQHKRLGIDLGSARYVISIDPANDRVVLGDADDLYSNAAELSSVCWMDGNVPSSPIRCDAKIRYRAKECPATVTPIGNDRARIVFETPQRAVTPGQSAVFYIGDAVAGGGIIDRPPYDGGSE